MYRVINNIKIVRLYSFIILIGAYLSAGSNGGNLPAPIPIDFDVNNGIRSDSTICESCNQEYDAEVMGASCCDEATDFNSVFTCEVLETTYLWNCSGCTCTEDNASWTTDFGCTDESACNYNSNTIWDYGICEYPMENYDCDGNCIAEIDCNNECGGSAELDVCGVCDGDDENVECWDGSMVCNALDCPDELTDCIDDPDICIWDSWYSDYDNQQDCEDNGGIWGGYLEYFGSSCSELLGSVGCDDSILYWIVSDLCPESCGECCNDDSACNDGDTDSGCEYPEDFGWCDCEENVLDACGDCGGDNSTCEDCAGVPNGDSVIDNCGTCDDDRSNDCVEDCFDVWGGIDYDQGCGCGVYDELPSDGCDDVCGSTAYEDNCGTCDDDASNDCVQDCFDVWGGTDSDQGCGCGVYDELPTDGCDNACGSILEFDECGICGGDGSSCTYWTELTAVGGENQISLSWEPLESEIPSLMNRDECEDDPDICIWNAWYSDYDNQQDCEDSGGIWDGYLEYFGSSCSELLDSGVGCDESILYWMVSDLCPESCGICAATYTYNVYRDSTLLVAGLDDASYINMELGYSESHCYTVTYTDSFGTESDYSNVACATTNAPAVYGCTDETACNYDPDATSQCTDDCCDYPEEEGFSCDGIPLAFIFNQSTLQAFYYFQSVTIYGMEVESEDWVGAFNGDVCVGAHKWDTSLCNGGICDVATMGDDGHDYSEGYLQEGDYLNFKIFDASENQYFAAYSSEEYSFSNNGIFFVETLSSGIDYTIILDKHHNLVSFYALPEDSSVSGIMSGLGDNAISVITEGGSAVNFDGVWSGSLTEFSAEKGFWISIHNYPDSLSVIGLDMNPDRMYELHEGPNLISFPDSGSVDLSSAIPDDVEHLFTAILSEGFSAMNTDDGWVGALTGFQGGAGYWVIVEEDLSFSYNTEDLLERSIHSFSEKLPDEMGFTVAQSPRQAFYYVDGIKLNQGGVEVGDWILSYNNDILSGIRQWNGNSIDIPSMGFAGDLVTAGYFNAGDVPTFKLLKQSNGELIALEGNIPNWSYNGIYGIGELYEKQPVPELFVLNKAYPNPFNPTTTIGFELPDRSEIVVEIYNLYGRRVETLVNESMQAGYKSVVWNADNCSSGLYFIKMSALSSSGSKYTSTQKLMLVK